MSPPPIASRRVLLRQSARVAGLLAGLGLLPAAAHAAARPAFQARTLPALVQALGASMPVDSPLVQLSLPDVAENGAVVPVRLAATAPGVRQLLLLVEKNPTLLCAQFQPEPSVDADFSLRVKLAESTDVLAVALMADERVLYTRRHVTVVLGGCA